VDSGLRRIARWEGMAQTEVHHDAAHYTRYPPKKNGNRSGFAQRAPSFKAALRRPLLLIWLPGADPNRGLRWQYP